MTVPKIVGRYFTVQFLNGWDETLANINERLFSQAGRRLCDLPERLQGPATPGVQHIDFSGQIFARAASSGVRRGLGPRASSGSSTSLHSRRLDLPKFPRYRRRRSSTSRSYQESKLLIMPTSYSTASPISIRVYAANARAIQRATKDDPAERDRIAKAIREQGLVEFAKYGSTIGHGVIVRTIGLVPRSSETTTPIISLVRSSPTAEFGPMSCPRCCTIARARTASRCKALGRQCLHVDLPERSAPAVPREILLVGDRGRRRSFPRPADPKKRYLLTARPNPSITATARSRFTSPPRSRQTRPEGNWLPTPKGSAYRLTFRFYGPLGGGVANGTCFPPPMIMASSKE